LKSGIVPLEMMSQSVGQVVQDLSTTVISKNFGWGVYTSDFRIRFLRL